MSASATLTNCYIPLSAPAPIISSNSTGDDRDDKTQASSRRRGSQHKMERSYGDGLSSSSSQHHHQTTSRTANSLRRVYMNRSILTKSNGSAIIELGQTKVICSVRGPRSPASSSLGYSSAADGAGANPVILRCEVRYAPHFGMRNETVVQSMITTLDSYGGGPSTTTASTSAEEVELSSRLRDAILPSINIRAFASSSSSSSSSSKSAVDVFVMILQADGNVLSTVISCASLALADAGIELFDLVSSCSVAVVVQRHHPDDDDDGDETITKEKQGTEKQKQIMCLADPTESEMLHGAEGVVTLAMMPNWKEVTFWEQNGRLLPTVSTNAVELCRDGCMTMYRFMRQCLVGNTK